MAVNHHRGLLQPSVSNVTIVILAVVTGCTRSEPVPLTNLAIERMSGTHVSSAYVSRAEYLEQKEVSDKRYEDVRKLLSYLGPIKSHDRATLEDVDYILLYQGGMDPTEIKVWIGTESLRYSVKRTPFVYTGGNPSEFRALMEQMLGEDANQK